MAAGSIIIDLLMRTGSFETDTARAAKSLKKLQREAEQIGKAFGVAIVGAAATLTYLVKSTIDANDHLNDLSQKTGIAADTLGGIGFAASQAGLDLDSAAAASGKLNKSLAEAAAGNKEAAEGFAALGISVTDASGRTKAADAVLAEVADRFEKFADGPEKSALALRLFGKAGADMIPLLNGGGDALREQIEYFRRYSGVTATSAREADEFNDTIGKLKLISGGFAQELATALLPALQGIAKVFLESRERGDGYRSTVERLADAFKALTTLVAFVGITFAETGNQIGAFFAQAAALARLDFAGFAAIGKEASADLENTRRGFLAFYDAIYAGRQKALGPITPGPDAAGNKPPAPRLTGGSPGNDAKRAADARLKLAEFTARQIVAIEEQAAEDTADAWQVWEKQQIDLSKARADAEIKQWQQVFDFIDQEQEVAIAEGAAFMAASKDRISELDNFAKNAAENIQRSFGDVLVSVMQGNFRNIGDSFKAMLDRMIAEALAANIVRALFGADDKGGVSGTGGLLGSLLKQFGTQILGFASGGDPPTNRVSLVGEHGPELFVPRTAGTIVPAGATTAIMRGAGMTYAPTFQIPATVDKRAIAQVEAAAYAGAQRSYARNT